MIYMPYCSCCAAAVRKEISDETDRETGRSKQISSVPIHLSIYSPNGKIMGFDLFSRIYFASCTFEVGMRKIMWT